MESHNERIDAPAVASSKFGRVPFEVLYREHVPAMRRIAIRRFHVCPADADALVHDVLISYLANPDIVRGSLRPYFAGAMSNAAQNYWRKRRPERALCDDDSMRAVEGDEPDRLATQLAIDTTLALLPERARDALRRHYMDGQSIEEIATSLDLEPSYVKVLLEGAALRAVGYLRELDVEIRRSDVRHVRRFLDRYQRDPRLLFAKPVR